MQIVFANVENHIIATEAHKYPPSIDAQMKFDTKFIFPFRIFVVLVSWSTIYWQIDDKSDG